MGNEDDDDYSDDGIELSDEAVGLSEDWKNR